MNRLPRPLTLVVGLAASALFLLGFVLPATTYQVDSEATSMTIAGTSTLHDWTCDVPGLEGRFQIEMAESDAADGSSTVPMQGLPAVNVQIPVQQIDCGKDRMNGNLRDALQANAYPTILFSIKSASFDALPDSSGTWFQVDATGELIVAGSRQEVTLDVKGERLDDGRLRFVGETPLKMTDFDVDPPSFMLGAVKTGDEVTVTFDVVAAPQS